MQSSDLETNRGRGMALAVLLRDSQVPPALSGWERGAGLCPSHGTGAARQHIPGCHTQGSQEQTLEPVRLSAL